MIILPINKVILASFAFALTHWKKIIEISILPALICTPFLMILPQMLEIMTSMLNTGEMVSVQAPDNMGIYLFMFLYGYLSLSINMYRLVMLGEESVSTMSLVFDVNQIMRFIGLTLIVGIVTTLPVMLTGMPFLQLIMYFLIIPITLNFVNISIAQPSKYKWNLGFVTQVNLFFLQAVLPAVVGMIFSALFTSIGLPEVFTWVVKVVVFYWTMVNLALCYQLIIKDSKA